MKTTPRESSVFSFESNTDQSTPQSIPDSCIENRHIDKGEITADKLAQEVVGSVVIGAPMVITGEISADASSGLVLLDEEVPFDLRIIDVIVECTSANASGTVTVSNGTTDITDAMVCAVDKTLVRAGTIDDEVASLSEGDSIVVTTNDADDRGRVSIIAVPV